LNNHVASVEVFPTYAMRLIFTSRARPRVNVNTKSSMENNPNAPIETRIPLEFPKLACDG
jgi:hypothetical protein